MEGYSWLCNDCKSCVVCHSSEDESTLLICDDCDRGWHLDCSDPKVTEVPQGKEIYWIFLNHLSLYHNNFFLI